MNAFNDSDHGSHIESMDTCTRLLLRNRRSPGDVLMLTAALRDLHRAFPSRYVTAVETSCMPLFRHNPLVLPRRMLGVPDQIIEFDGRAVDRSNHRPLHYLQACVEDLANQLGVQIPVGPFRGEVYLSPREAQQPSPVAQAGHAGAYWIIMAGGKYDFTTKWWNPQWFQEVVDHFRGKITFVQCGERKHWHPRLRNVINLVGATDVRRFVRVMYHADGVLCPITFAMHLSVAVPPKPGGPCRRACVVIAGGLEPPHWEMYPGHQFLHTVGALDCCAVGGCWRPLCQTKDHEAPEADRCLQPVTVGERLKIGKCMTMITPEKVIRAIETYYEGGVLRYETASDRAAASSTSPARRTTARKPSSRGVAVTIGTGNYAQLARLAAREIRQKTGLETLVIGNREFAASGLEHPQFLKFRLFDLVDAENILFFDADLVCLDRWDPAAYFDLPQLVAVMDPLPGDTQREADDWGVPRDEYVNTGLLILNRKHHHPCLRLAESLRGRHKTNFRDQSAINAARVQLGIPLKLLDRRFNWTWFGASSLSHQVPVVMAHKLEPYGVRANLRFLKGETELLPPTITLDDAETRRLCGKLLTYTPADGPSSALTLREDGVISPSAGAEGPRYWFVHAAQGKPTLALTSATRILDQFVQRIDGLWSSVTLGGTARCVDESVYREVSITPRNARSTADRFLRTLAPFPAHRYEGRGIVICSGEWHFPSAWVCIHMLRHLGCKLPIELWHLGDADLPPHLSQLVSPYKVRCVDAGEVRQRYPVRLLTGWGLKPYAILHSAFEELVFLDADNVPVDEPSRLFRSGPYKKHGAIFWPDQGRLAPDEPIWRICRTPYRDEPELESGQILINKGKCWRALQLTMHLNEHSDFYYNYIHGDKETFHMAWRMLGLEYGLVPHPIHQLPGTMCQHDFSGQRLFQHRNGAKWVLGDANRRIEGFKYEDLCLKFLSALNRKLDNGLNAEWKARRR